MFDQQAAAPSTPASRATEPERAAIESLEAEVAELAADIYAAQARLAAKVAELSARGRASLGGDYGTPEWVAWRLSVTRSQARELLVVGRALHELPATAAAFGSGELSLAKVALLSKVATHESDEVLLDWARHGTADQLAGIVARYRALERVHSGAARERDRFVDRRYDDSGGFMLRTRLDADEGALVDKALDAALKALIDDAGTGTTGDERPSLPDALVAMAETTLQDGLRSGTGGERYQVLVTVEADDLRGHDDGCPSLEGVPIEPETARRLSCDCSFVGLISRDGVPLETTTKARTIPRRLRRAVWARDHGCRFPGCRRRAFIDIHHIRYWIEVKEHRLANLLSLCWRHHHAVHEGGYRVALVDGRPVFTDPQRRVLEPSPALRAPERPLEPAETALVLGYDDPIDYHHAVDSLWFVNGPTRDRDPPDDG